MSEARLRIAEATAAGIASRLGPNAPAAAEAVAIVEEMRRVLADGRDPDVLARLVGRLEDLDAGAHRELGADAWEPGDSGDSDTRQDSPGDKGECRRRRPVPRWRPFPAEALPEPVSRYVRRAARALGCDPSYVALPLLAGLASAIGNTYRVALKRGWTEPAILWAVIVGESGTLKSPALELALRPVRARQHDAMRRHAEDRERHAAELLIYERDLADWKKRKGAGDAPAKPAEPIAERTWVDDVTTEALAARLLENPRGLLLARDELSAWLDFDRYSNGKGADAARWLEVFGGRALIVDRRTGPTVYVRRATVSIAGGIQPRILTRTLGEQHRENGLLARLLLACPPTRVKSWTDAELSDADETAMARVYADLYALEPDRAPDGSDRPHVVGLDPEARALWVSYYDEHAAAQADLTGDLAAASSKLEGYAARLALVVHLVRAVQGRAQLDRLDAASMEAGITLARWFRGETERVYGILAEGVPEREQRRLLEWIASRGGSATVRDLTRGPRRYRDDPEAAQNVLDELVAADLAEWVEETPSRGGWPVRTCRLVGDGGDWRHSAGSPGGNGQASPSPVAPLDPDDPHRERRL